MALRGRNTPLIGLAAGCLMLVMGPAAVASANADVRLVNARGTSAAALEVSVSGQKVGAGSGVGYGLAGATASVPAGQARLSIAGKSVTERLANGRSYTVVALPRNAIQVLRNGSASARQARVRIVHAAPELGTPDVRLGRRTIAQGVKFRSATGYLTVDPGAYMLAVTKPNGGAAVFKGRVSLAAGTATTVVVAGTGGNPERLIVTNDGTVTPHGAPHTGFGALAGGGQSSWVYALIAALIAGCLGGATHFARTRRARL
jgi:hypothetical protein